MKIKKFLAGALSVAMLLGTMVVPTFAAGTGEPSTYEITTLTEAEVVKAITENAGDNYYGGEDGLYHKVYKKVAEMYNGDTSKAAWAMNLHKVKSNHILKDIELSSDKDVSLLVVIPTEYQDWGIAAVVVNLNDENNHTEKLSDFFDSKVYNTLFTFKDDIKCIVVPFSEELYTTMYEVSDTDLTYTKYKANMMDNQHSDVCTGNAKVSFKMCEYVWDTSEKLYVNGGAKEFNYTVPGNVKLSDGRVYLSLAEAVEKAEKGDTITVLSDLVGEGITFDKDKDLTIDFNNHKYSVEDKDLLAGSTNTKSQVFQCLKGVNVTLKNGTLESSVATRYIQNYANLTLDNMTLDASANNNVDYVISNNCGDTVITGNTTIKAPKDQFAFDCYYWAPYYAEGVSVVVDENMTGTIDGKVELAFGGATAEEAATKQSLAIKGGTYTYPDTVRAFIADGYGMDKNNKVMKSESKIVNTASASGVTVELPKLNQNEKIDVSEDVTYEVKVSSVKAEDREKVEQIKAENSDKTVVAYDISVVKTANGKSEKVAVENQKVTLTLPTALPEGTTVSDVKVAHIKSNGDVETINVESISSDRKSITFTAPSFSSYVVTYSAATVAVDNVTSNIKVEFKPVTGKKNEYDIVLKADDGKVINGLMSADLTFELTQGTGVVSYEVKPVANINVLNPSDNRYAFYFDGVNEHEATSDSLTIGTVVFGGYCKDAKFAVKALDTTNDTNIVHTTVSGTAHVEDYTVSGAKGLVIADSKIEPLTIKEDTKKLTINVTFPNKVEDNAIAYQDMKVSIVSADSNDEVALGGAMTTDGKYVIEKELVKNKTYTVTVSGAGYRTARYNVTMTEDKELNFWNSYEAGKIQVETGAVNSEKTTTFLAGELVKDENINIYDLSAVVSYFGKINDVTEESPYAQYDLNRDGKVDSKDVAYVLVSWGK